MASFKEQAKAKFDRFCEELKTTTKFVDLPPMNDLPRLRCLTDGWDWEVQLSRALTCSHVSDVSVRFNDISHFRNVDPMIPYLQSSPHLRTMRWSSYTNEGFDDDRTHAILNALSENRFIERLDLNVNEPFDCILKSVKTVGTLILGADFSAAKMDEIGQVLKENPRLQKLEISHPTHAKHLLQHLTSHPKLTALTISQYCLASHNASSVREGLALFVASTSMLQRLQIQDIAFVGKQAIEPLIQALRQNQSVVSLAFQQCSFNRDAADELSSLFRCRPATSTRLQLATADETGRRVRVRLLGPSLQALTICGGRQESLNGVVGLLLSSIGNFASRLRLRTLHIRYIDAAADTALAKLLRKTAYLETLTLSLRTYAKCSNELMSAFKRNGSLTSVSLFLEGEPNQIDCDMEAKIHAFCKRNAAVPSLLETAQEGGGSTNDRHFIAPLLFWVVQQAPKTARSKILAGLLALKDPNKVGRRGSAEKRLQRSS